MLKILFKLPHPTRQNPRGAQTRFVSIAGLNVARSVFFLELHPLGRENGALLFSLVAVGFLQHL